MLSAGRGMWQRFTYHNAVKLEAKRQKLKQRTDVWAVVYESLTGDDAFSTFIQVRILFTMRNSSQGLTLQHQSGFLNYSVEYQKCIEV